MPLRSSDPDGLHLAARQNDDPARYPVDPAAAHRLPGMSGCGLPSGSIGVILVAGSA